MQIKCSSFSDMAKQIQLYNKKIVMFGAGVIGTVTAPEVLSYFHIDSYVECYLDNDTRRWGGEVSTRFGKVKICSPEHLKELGCNTVILLNISRYSEVLQQLESMDCTQNMMCYIMPMMCIHNFYNEDRYGVIRQFDKMCIPKKIHYMWLGGKSIPEKLQKCIDSWKRYCPDYEIIRWDESNYDIDKNLYMKQAYDEGAYGFVPDYARLDILYHHGGVYMDTDVEVARNLDDLLYQQAFCGVEKWQVINFGGCSGAVKGHKAIAELLNERENIQFIEPDGSLNKNTCGYYDTRVVLQHGYKLNGKNQTVLGMNIYTYDYFHPYDYMSGCVEITENTFTIHHFNGGWLDDKMRFANEKTAKEFEKIYRCALCN